MVIYEHNRKSHEARKVVVVTFSDWSDRYIYDADFVEEFEGHYIVGRDVPACGGRKIQHECFLKEDLNDFEVV